MNAVHCVVLGLAIAVEGLACLAQEASNRVQLPQNEPVKMNLVRAGDNGAGKALSDFHPGTASAGGGFVSSDASDCRLKVFPAERDSTGHGSFRCRNDTTLFASHHCRETNPVMPTSQAGQLSVKFALVACNSGISYWLKKHGSKLWWLPPSAGVVVLSVGVTTGFEHQ